MTPDIRTNPHAEAWLDSERVGGAQAAAGTTGPAAEPVMGNAADSAHQDDRTEPVQAPPSPDAKGLIVSRLPGDRVIIRVPGYRVPLAISVLDVRGDKVRLKFVAPREVSCHREAVDRQAFPNQIKPEAA